MVRRGPDPFVPIADYALIGDGRAAALVAKDGRIDWLALPTLDAPPVCAALIDVKSGGTFACAPAEQGEVERCYRKDTNILETTFTTSSGVVRLTDAMTVGRNGPLPWRE